MCGIAGFFSARGAIPESSLQSATAALVHRGPDDSGVQLLTTPVGVLGLGNRRLAIVDLSPAGHQPMHDEQTGNWITYNGEVYNFPEMRQELERQGRCFASHTDTEVLLKSYSQYGIEAIERWRGMFACALWDNQRRKLVLVRDRLGIKPLYYSLQDGNLVFASEVRALLVSGLVPRRLSLPGVLSFLSWGSIEDPLTIVEGVHSLLPGHYLEFDGANLELRRYWDLPEPQPAVERPASYPELVEQTRALLRESVRLRLISDVPIGAFLSGGIDSSSVVALMSQEAADVKTFSIAFSEQSHNEAPFAREIARKYSTQHTELLVTESDVLRELDDALAAMDQPSIDGINTYFVSQATRHAGITVALSGLGGDEVFGGYGTFRVIPRMERVSGWLRHLPGAPRHLLGAALALAGLGDKWRKLAFFIGGNGGFARHPYFLARCLFDPQQVQAMVRPEVLDQVHRSDAFGAAESYRAQLLEQAARYDSFNRISCLELRTYMANTLLRDTDAMSMAHSLEVRVPLIDHKLVEHVLAIPGSLKLDAHTPKRLLVDALAGGLPDSIVHRPKWGFTFPWHRWLRQELRPTMESVLIGASGPLQETLSPESASRQWKAFLAGSTGWSRPWALFVLSRWCDLHLASRPAAVAVGAGV